METRWLLPDFEVLWEEPDVIVIRCLNKEITGETARQLMKLHEEFYRRAARPYLFVDLTQGGHPGPEARKVFGAFEPGYSYRAVILVGGSTFTRTMVVMILRGLSMLGRFSGELSQHAQEADARRWMEEHRLAWSRK